ncbi:hypothetical protein FOZ63_011220 [Perkinsus olseni]|uniref:Uncharacterized protein n=1 Tax=Perkinsus olseni TaxID=32597 RepID=A0A7J6TSK6_PEROL|nr:hypothetical protein FOZ63_011220 [Perkinsus olseni]
MSGLITVRILEAVRDTLQHFLASPNLGLFAWTLLFGAPSGSVAVATPSSSTGTQPKRSNEGRRLLVSVSLDGVPRSEAVYAALQKLSSCCDLVVEMVASSDEEENSGRQEISQKVGIPAHRVLFSSTTSGRASMIRQLNPAWHLDTDEGVLKYLIGLVPHLATISATAAKAASGDGDFITVFSSIDSFADSLSPSTHK